MYGLAIATTVASRPTITIPRETVTRVHHGLPRMRALALRGMSRSSSAVMFSHGGPGGSPLGCRLHGSDGEAHRRERVDGRSTRRLRAGAGNQLSRLTSMMIRLG